MCRDLPDLYRYRARFKGQRAYCEELRAWCTAVPSASGHGLVWLLPPTH